ncbi:PRC-barrel domain-containing protein [Caenispirillum salinarum]|uniref:PRC-barrel domain-containing protein n=1 Tax=Caenispirillum salinarum TaxID=859058 RepID=UPI00384D740A
MTRHIGVSALAIAMTLGGAALAQDSANQNQQMQDQQQAAQGQQQQQQQGQNQDIQVLSQWNYDELYEGGLRAETMLGADVFGPNMDDIGDVENVILDRDNQIVAIIAEIGGFLDIGDTHVAVPWDQVKMTQGGFQIPVDEDNLDQYGLYAEPGIVNKSNLQSTRVVDEDLIAGRNTWKLTGLIDDYAVLNNGAGYGYIDDAIFTQDGKLDAVVVQPDYAGYGMGGAYAYPFYGYRYGWSPDAEAYDLRYAPDEMAEMEPFDYGRMQGPAQTAMEPAGQDMRGETGGQQGGQQQQTD